MCDVDAPPSVYEEFWSRARKEHECCACDEKIRKGDRYHVVKGKWDGEFSQYKHCARCWKLFELLNEANPGEVALGLDCGEIYEGKDPELLSTAFMTKDDAQRFAERQLAKKVVDPLERKAESYARYGNPTEYRNKWRQLADATPAQRRLEFSKEEGH